MQIVISERQAKANISSNLLRLLEERGWSRYRLAKECGESQMNLSRIVRKKNLPSIVAVARIAEALGVTVDELLQASENTPVGA